MALQNLRSSTANKRPVATSLSDGQIAINTNAASPGIFFKNSSNVLTKVGPIQIGTSAPNSSPAGSAGNAVGEQWLDTSGSTVVLKVWNGSAWQQQNKFSAVAGTAAAPLYSFSGDPNTGIYSPGADQVAVATNGVERLKFDTTEVVFNDGGTDYDFRVESDTNANLFFVDASTNAIGMGVTPNIGDGLLSLIAPAASNGAGTANVRLGMAIYESASSRGLWLGARTDENTGVIGTRTASGNLAFETYNGGWGERMRLTYGGRLGIGTSSVGSLLHLKQNIAEATTLNAAGSHLQINSGSGTGTNFRSTIYFSPLNGSGNNSPAAISAIASGNTNSSLGFYTNPANDYSGVPDLRMLIDSSGKVGIGTTTVDEHLHIEGIGTQRVKIEATDTSIAGLVMLNTNRRYDVQVNGSDLQIYDNTASAERARIDSSGRLLVGTSSTSADASTLLQGSSGSSTGQARLFLARGNNSPASGDFLGSVLFSDSGHTASALVRGERDGGTWTPGSSLPGRLVFSVTRDGQASPTESFRISNTGAQSSVIPGGSTLYPQFACRAWVNFNGTGTVAIRGSGNVSSITDIAASTYTVNLTTSVTDANYSAQVTSGFASGVREDVLGFVYTDSPYAMTASACTVKFVRADTNAAVDTNFAMVAIFR